VDRSDARQSEARGGRSSVADHDAEPAEPGDGRKAAFVGQIVANENRTPCGKQWFRHQRFDRVGSWP
jgi:hypothetical protein